MAVVFTDGALRAIRGAVSGAPAYSPPVTDVLWQRGAYAHLYRSQPSVRTAVDLLGRNIAQMGLHLFRRTEDGSRIRDREAGPSRLIARPQGTGGTVSTYHLILETVLHFAIYGEAYWWKAGPSGARTGLSIVHPAMLRPLTDGLTIRAYEWTVNSERIVTEASNFVRFWWPDPEDSARACPWLETLRMTISEDQAAQRHRSNVWRTGARWAGVIERPKTAGLWTDAQRARFRSQLEQEFAGDAGAGRVVMLEDDMKFKETAWSLQETQAYETRKENANEITRTYQIPLPMAGILDHATFSNIKEQHRNLYQDCLGPVMTQIEEALAVQLLDEYGLFDTHYYEFNVNEKLKGAFEEQVAALAKAIDGPWMTPNEGRARVNLPAVAGGEQLYPQRGSGQPVSALGQPSETAEPQEAVH